MREGGTAYSYPIAATDIPSRRNGADPRRPADQTAVGVSPRSPSGLAALNTDTDPTTLTVKTLKPT